MYAALRVTLNPPWGTARRRCIVIPHGYPFEQGARPDTQLPVWDSCNQLFRLRTFFVRTKKVPKKGAAGGSCGPSFKAHSRLLSAVRPPERQGGAFSATLVRAGRTLSNLTFGPYGPCCSLLTQRAARRISGTTQTTRQANPCTPLYVSL